MNKKAPIQEWVIIESVNGICRDGFPVGKILCRFNDAEKIIENFNIETPRITKYMEKKMSKWIFSPKNKTFWNLDKVEKIRLEETCILLIYEEDGEQHVEFELQKDLLDAWDKLWHNLSDA